MALAVISGGSRGIGLAITKQLLACESISHVAVLGRSSGSLDDLRQVLVNNNSQKLSRYQCDVSNPNDVNECMSRMKSEVNQDVKYLVNAAGIVNDNLLMRTSNDTIASVIGTNLMGPMYLTRAVMKDLLRTKGAVVNIGSIVGSTGNAGQSVYSASKAGLIGFTKSLAKEMGPKKVRINIIEPGYITTDMTEHLDRAGIEKNIPLRSFGQPEHVAGVARFLLLDPASEYITGQVFRVDGGIV